MEGNEIKEFSEIADDFDKTLRLTVESSSEDHDEEIENRDDENEEFEFCFIGGDLNSPISAEEVFKDGQIRVIAPYSNEIPDKEAESSYEPPVKKLFIVSPTSSENDDVAKGPYCTWKSPEMSRKSNSTGFSKLWKVRDLVARSNSDGKDAFVFLTGKNNETTSLKKKSETTAFQGERKEKMKKKSAYEVLYGEKNDKRRLDGKSYLPYRKDLVGFFTNGNSGLSRNIHPY
ncbi:unnamed protein product [Amaranthus hypochondriacus]